MGIESKPRGRILVVDDEKSVGRLLQQWLTGKGYQVRHVDGFDGVRQALTEQAFDLVTLDIMMPGVDGLEVLRWLRAHYPDVGVVMATALDRLDTVLEAMRAGAINYLLKPFNLDLVGEEIGRAMEHQRLKAENRAYQQELERRVEERTGQLRVAHARLEQQVRELEGRDRLARLQMDPPDDGQQADDEILRVVAQVTGAGQVGLWRPDESGEYLEKTASIDAAGPEERAASPVPETLARLPIRDTERLPVRVFREGRPATGCRGEAAVPILYSEAVLGVLQVIGLPEEERRLDVLWRLGREAALLLRMVQVVADLEQGEGEIGELLQGDEGEGISHQD